jgi:hypothetical protein
VLAAEPQPPDDWAALEADQAATRIRHLLADGGVSGELIRIGAGHAGKVLP